MRDLDVQRERLARSRPLIGAKAAAAIDAIFRERRERARGEMLAALDSERYTACIERLSELLRARPAGGAGERPALECAPALIAQWRRRVRREGNAIGGKSPDSAYHDLRITVRKLRYVLEFFAPLHGEPAEAYRRHVTRLQNLLGEHQDAAVAANLYGRLAREEDERLGKAGARGARELAANAAAEAESFRWKFPKRFSRLRGSDWRRYKAAMAKP